MSRIHDGDVGTVFTVTMKDEDGVVVDISSFTTRQLLYRKPDGTVDTQTAAFVTDGTDGKITYTTAAGDIDLPGNWRIQPKLTKAGGVLYGSAGDFEVYGVLA